MNILITGANGQLGNEFKRIFKTGFAEIGPIPVQYRGAMVDYVDVEDLDISDAAQVENFFFQRSYDLVINGAAITNVDGCETQEDVAYRVNATGPQLLALACRRQNAKFVQVSTDYVFSGTDSEPRVEQDATAPMSAYGRTKLAGEMMAQKAWNKTFVVRTAWLYGYVGHNFVKTMLGLAKNRKSVTVVNDQFGNPTSANDLAYEILKIALNHDYGIYHCTNNGTCSWYDFASAIMSGAGIDCEVIGCSSEEYAQINPQSANRPAFSSLRNKHLEDTIGDEMRSWQDALAAYLFNIADLKG